MTTSEKPKPPRKKPQRNVKPAPPREKATLHPRNRHQGHYDFPKLIKSSPEPDSYTQVASCCLLYTSDAADE